MPACGIDCAGMCSLLLGKASGVNYRARSRWPAGFANLSNPRAST